MAVRAKHKLMRTAVSFTLAIVPLLMVMGLLAPVAGPAIDHHYADRSPAHGHAFYGDVTNDHIHSLAPGDYDHSSGENGDGVSTVSTPVSSAHGPLTLDGATSESFVPTFNDHMIAMYVGKRTVPDGQEIAPFDRPPRLG